MSPLQEKPILHGRDHCAGGADPIPCLITGPSGDFETVVLASDDLYAYWRLGETGSPWADTSGVGTAADMTETDSGTALTPDVTGALPAATDDGALEFNYNGHAIHGGRYLHAATAKSFDVSGGIMSVGAWVKVKASTDTRRGTIVGNVRIRSAGGDHYTGWGLQVVYPARTVRFTRGQVIFPGAERYAETTGGVVAGDWNFFVGTYDGTEIKLYENGVLVDTTADTSAASASSDADVWIGYGNEVDGFTYSWLYGTVDEAAVWTRALTQAEINSLYEAGVEGAGAGQNVLLSDGAGGTYWGQVPEQALGNDAVTTSKIADGTIVDADVATAADIDPAKLDHPGGTTTFLRADGTWATPTGGGGASLTDTLAWMPLVDSDGLCVLDSGDTLIPTLITL